MLTGPKTPQRESFPSGQKLFSSELQIRLVMAKVAPNSGITRGTSATLFLAIVYRCELCDCLGSVGPNCGLMLEGP